MIDVQELVKPVFVKGNTIGLLLIHGFTASPGDMKPIAKILAEYGYSIYIPLLSGHGHSAEDMAKTEWKDWVSDVEKGVDYLRESCSKVIAVGHSMGGLLSLHLASAGKIDAVVTINAPFVYQNQEIRFVKRLAGKNEYIEKLGRTEEIIVDRGGIPHYSFTKVPVCCLVSLNKAITTVLNELRRITCPVLVIQSLMDKTVNPRSGRMIEKSIKRGKVEIIYWEKADHYLPLGPEKHKVAEKINDFLIKYREL
ncbi:MAG: alpha/beta fold hydrolase [Eubacteriales bacterium]